MCSSSVVWQQATEKISVRIWTWKNSARILWEKKWPRWETSVTPIHPIRNLQLSWWRYERMLVANNIYTAIDNWRRHKYFKFLPKKGFNRVKSNKTRLPRLGLPCRRIAELGLTTSLLSIITHKESRCTQAKRWSDKSCALHQSLHMLPIHDERDTTKAVGQRLACHSTTRLLTLLLMLLQEKIRFGPAVCSSMSVHRWNKLADFERGMNILKIRLGRSGTKVCSTFFT